MKKSIAIFGLFLIMVSLTSFTSANEIGGRGTDIPVGQIEIGGRGTDIPVGQIEIGGRGTDIPVGQ